MGAAMAERESIARGIKKDIVFFLREKRAKVVGDGKEELLEIQTKVQLKYSGARDCETREQRTRHVVTVIAQTLSFQPSCPPARHR